MWLATSGVEVVAVTSEALTTLDGSLNIDQMPRIKPVVPKQLKIESQSLSVNIGARTNLPLGIRIMFVTTEVAPVSLALVGVFGASLSKRDRMLRLIRREIRRRRRRVDLVSDPVGKVVRLMPQRVKS